MTTCKQYFFRFITMSLVTFSVILFMITILNTGITYGTSFNSKQKKELKNLARPEVTQSATALGFAMKGKLDPASLSPVVFENLLAVPKIDPVIQRDGFWLLQVATSSHERIKGDPAQRSAEGVLTHRDAIGRFVLSSYSVQFRVEKNGRIAIQQAEVKPVDSPLPRVFFYYVPASRISQSILKTGSFTKLLKYVSKNSVPVFGDQPVDRSEKEYYVFAFFMDRASTDADVQISLVKEIENQKPARKSSASISFQDDGWHVAWLPAKFALDGDKTVAFKVLYTPGSNAPPAQRRQLIADVFTSNISDTSAAFVMQIQEALADQGYHPGPANGKVSRATVAAIETFQKDHKIAVDGRPSKELYQILTGKFRQPILADRKTAPPPNPVKVLKVQLKVLKVQHWLSTLGYYHGPINGKMNRETKDAMARFEQEQAQDKEKRAASTSRMPPPAAKKVTTAKSTGMTGQSMDVSAIQNRYRSKMWPNRIKQPQEPKVAKGHSIFPEPMMFVVPANALNSKKLPGSYAKLLQFVGERAVPFSGGTMEKREYFIFVFLKDKVSPTSKLKVKISNSEKGNGGYAEGTKFLSLNGRYVAYLSGKVTLFSKSAQSLFYVKAIFSPGKEVGRFSRSPWRVGLFSSDGT